jgi:GntP family gluconate:H+ symporter
LFTLLLPGLLILAKTIADLDLAPASPFRGLADALGAPTIALLAAVLVGTFTLGAALGLTRDAIAHRVASGLPAMAAILLVIGAGGAFKQVLVDSGIGAALASAAALAHLSPLVVGWLLAVTIRLATGSATVATTTAAGVMAAAVQGTSVDRSLLALSIGGGSLFFSHVNDAGFWMVRELLGLSVADTFKTWSVMETLISLAVLGLVLAASVVL